VIPPYGGTKPLCSTLTQEQLENTFFFPSTYDRQPSKAAQAAWDEAKETCLDCPFMLRCAEEHKGEDYGVWGGVDQYERYMERRRMSQRRQRSAPDKQAAEAARVYAMHAGHRGLPVHEVALRTGHSVKAVNAMIEAHEAASAAPAEPEAPAPAPRRIAPAWPADWPPQGDTWVWAEGSARSGHVVAVTADGAFVRVKFRGARKAHVIRWFPADQVQIRTQTALPVAEFKGRTDDEAQAA
jgi:pyruvate/2-oxoglutarate dehydrogenase complex dihydrolipoamide acyltransferase (E2) component